MSQLFKGSDDRRNKMCYRVIVAILFVAKKLVRRWPDLRRYGDVHDHVTDDDVTRGVVADGAEFYAGYPAYADYFASHHHHHHHPHHAGPDPASAMTYLPPTSGQQPPTLLDHQVSGIYAVTSQLAACFLCQPLFTSSCEKKNTHSNSSAYCIVVGML